MNNKNFISWLVICCIFSASSIVAQGNPKNDTIKNTPYIYGDYIIFEGDTLVIELEEVRLLKKLKFKNNKDRRYYYWFRKKVHNAYPYAKLAEDKLSVINLQLEKIKSKRKRKKYTKRMQKYFEEEFTDQLKKLTRTEGRILIKLIHRQTGRTSFEMVKDLRSGWKAFWYENTAKVFKLSLKNEYHPESVAEDFLIEDILQRAFNDLTLQSQETKLDFSFDELSKKRNDYIYIDR